MQRGFMATDGHWALNNNVFFLVGGGDGGGGGYLLLSALFLSP